VGAGWNTGLADNVDLLIEGEFLSTDIAANTTNTGWGANAGLRFQLAPMFELDGIVSHTDVNSQTENTLGLRGQLGIDKYWHVYASYANNSDYDTFMIGVRYDF
jgi:opacity protein-like surface antigen